MAFSTETQLKNNVKIIERTIASGDQAAWTAERIALADKRVKTDLSNCIDFTAVNEITEDPPTPDFINLLSQYKAAEYAYVRLGSVKRRFNEQDDRQYWTEEYDMLLNKVKMGGIKLEDEDGNNVGLGNTRFSNTSKQDVKPEFGYGAYGQSTDEDTLEDIRDANRSRENYN